MIFRLFVWLIDWLIDKWMNKQHWKKSILKVHWKLVVIHKYGSCKNIWFHLKCNEIFGSSEKKKKLTFKDNPIYIVLFCRFEDNSKKDEINTSTLVWWFLSEKKNNINTGFSIQNCHTNWNDGIWNKMILMLMIDVWLLLWLFLTWEKTVSLFVCLFVL